MSSGKSAGFFLGAVPGTCSNLRGRPFPRSGKSSPQGAAMSTIRRSHLHAAPVRPRPSSPRGWAIVVATAFLLVPSLGANPPEADQPADKPETLVMFDGKGLDGWKKADYAGAGAVKVEGGVIVMGVGKSMTGITSTRQDLPRTNYELSYEAI